MILSWTELKCVEIKDSLTSCSIIIESRTEKTLHCISQFRRAERIHKLLHLYPRLQKMQRASILRKSKSPKIETRDTTLAEKKLRSMLQGFVTLSTQSYIVNSRPHSIVKNFGKKESLRTLRPHRLTLYKITKP